MTTFTDAELDTLTQMLVQTNPHKIGFYGPTRYNRDGHSAAAAITYLRAQRREDALQYLSDEGQIADRIDAAVKAERER